MLWENLIEHVQTNRFDRSYSIFADAIDSGQVDSIADAISDATEGDPKILIQIRDHVSFFLDCFPVYFSVGIGSAEMLRIILNAENVADAQIAFFEWFKEMLAMGDSRVTQYKLEIESMSTSIYSQLLPNILVNRTDELESCKIPFSVITNAKRTRIRYSIHELFKTAYGLQLLQALEIEPNHPIIGEEVWSELSMSLIALGYEPNSLLVEMDKDVWSSQARGATENYLTQTGVSKELRILQEI
ncbi:MAG: hypothetical protein ACTSUB_00330, partial [Candidatus Thorarchaeota archaeon]